METAGASGPVDSVGTCLNPSLGRGEVQNQIERFKEHLEKGLVTTTQGRVRKYYTVYSSTPEQGAANSVKGKDFLNKVHTLQ